MTKEFKLVIVMKLVEEANGILTKANNILKDMEDNEGSLMGQGILRNLNHLRDHVGNEIVVEKIEMGKKKETEIEE